MRVVIITPLELELRAMREHVADWREVTHQGSVYTCGVLRARPHDCEVCLVQTGPGNNSAGVEAANAIGYFRPDVLILVGIAAGLKDAQIGDVVAADRVYNYERGKVRDSGIEPRFDGRDCAYRLVSRARSVSRNDVWKQALAHSPISLVDAIVSGEKVIAGRGSPIFRLIKQVCGQAQALETEGRGVLEAAYERSVDAIDIRGISDYADEAKSLTDEPTRQVAAARHAAAFAAELLRTLEVDEPRVDVPRPPLPTTPAFFPPAAGPILEELQLSNPDVYRRLVEACTDPRVDLPAAVGHLITGLPPWIATEVGALIALGHLASGLNLDREAASAFETVGMAGHPPVSHWFAWAALHSAKLGDMARSEELLGRARAAGPTDALVEILECAIRNDQEGIVPIRADEAQLDGEEQLVIAAMRGNALVLLGRFDEAEPLLRRLTTEHPDRAMVKVQLASLMNGRVSRQASRDRQGELAQARQLAIQARDILRSRRMDSSPAVTVLCQTALLQGNPLDALDFALGAPEGEATAGEADSPEVAAVGTEAALMVGADKLAQRLLELIHDPFEKARLAARIALRGEDGKDLAMARFTEALSFAPDDLRRAQVLMELAETGTSPLPIDPTTLAIDAITRDIILARSDMFRGLLDAAIARLRPHQNVSLAAAHQLGQVHLRNQDPAGAMEILAAAAERFQAPELRLQALDIAREAGLWRQALAIGEETLPSLDPNARAAHYVRHRLIEIGARLADWRTVERYARVELRDDPVSPSLRWAFVIAVFNQARFDEAWEAFSTPANLEPQDELTARMMIQLLGHFLDAGAAAPRILAVAESFADSEELVGAALATIYRSRAALPSEVAEGLKVRTEEFLARFPESPYFRSVAIESPEQLLEMMNQLLREGAEELDQLQVQVSGGAAPYGLLVATARNRPYLHGLISAGGGPLVGVSLDGAIRVIEKEAAERALDGPVVMEGSAMVVWPAISRLWTTVLGSFRRTSVTDLSVFDAVSSRDEAALRPTLVVTYDPDSARARPVEIPEAEAERVAQQCQWVADALLALDQHAVRELSRFPGLEIDRYGAWLGAVELAAIHEAPLYSDDIAVRALARANGVAAFGTHELASALVAAGRMSAEDETAVHEAMLRQRIVDLPSAPELIVRLGGAAAWTRGPWVLAASRPALWINPEAGVRTFGNILDRVATEAPDQLLRWACAAMLGGAALPNIRTDEFVAHIALMAEFAARPVLGHLTEAVRIARDVARRAQGDDPLPAIARRLNTLLEESLGAGMAAQVAVGAFSGLEESDRILVLRVIADPNNRTG